MAGEPAWQGSTTVPTRHSVDHVRLCHGTNQHMRELGVGVDSVGNLWAHTS